MLKHLSKYFLLSLLLFVGLISCEPVEGKNQRLAPDDLIAKKKMTQMLIDMHLIEGARSGMRILGDSADVDVYYDGLWRKYDVTQEQYDSSFRYYTRHPDVMMEMYDVVIDSLRLREIKITEQARNFRPGGTPDVEEELEPRNDNELPESE